MYQTMCIKNNNFDWIFIDYKPNLRNLNSLSQVGDILTSLTSRDYVLQNPQYKYTFRAGKLLIFFLDFFQFYLN